MAFDWKRLLGGQPVPLKARRARLVMDAWPATVYAVGDVHGCFAQLQDIEEKIIRDGADRAGDKLIVMLGDYVDRGPKSASVLDFLLQKLPAGFERLCLAGNHEIMMLEHLASGGAEHQWLAVGGDETLRSYGIDIASYLRARPADRAEMLALAIPQAHIDFIAGLPVTLSLPGAVFVHAGLRAGVPVERQDEMDLLWMRYPQTSSAASSLPIAGGSLPLIVHGHTPAELPVVAPNRICLDTGAFSTGILTAARLQPGEQPYLFNSFSGGTNP